MKRYWNCGAAIVAIMASGSAMAQGTPETEGASGGLDEIVVTARRQAESLVRVPLTITAVPSQELVRSHVTNLETFTEVVPGLTIARGTSGSAGVFSIRGVGSPASDSGIEQTVAVNIDDVSVSRGRVATASQFDLGQIEILKGPQALFFGKNSPGGVISISTADPTNELSGYARAGYEFTADERYVDAAISGGLTDTLSARLAGRYSQMSGWIHNDAVARPNPFLAAYPFPGAASGRSPSVKAAAGRLTLLWKPTSDFTARFKFMLSRETGDGGDAAYEAFCRNGNANPTVLNPLTGVRAVDLQQNCTADRHRASSALPTGLIPGFKFARDGKGYDYTNSQLGSLQLTYAPGDITFTSVSGYIHLKARNSTFGTLTSINNVFAYPAEKYESISQEFRAVSSFDGPLNFNAGAYYDHSRRENQNIALIGFPPNNATTGQPFDPATGNINSLQGFFVGKGRTLSAYGQLRYNPFEQVEVTGGVRYTRERRTLRGGNIYTHPVVAPAFRLAPAGALVNRKNSFSNWSPEVTASYHPTERSTIYVAYKTGYKSGGFSNPATFTANFVANPGELEFQPEKAKGFEGGVKAELFGRTLRAELIAYRYNFSNLQLTAFNPTLLSFTIRNAGRSRTSGVEASFDWRATNELTLVSNIAYNKAKFTSFANATCYTGQTAAQGCVASRQDRSGQPLTRAPRWALNSGFRYKTEIANDWRLALSGDAIYSGRFFLSDAGDPNLTQKSFWKFNASASIQRGDQWEIAVIGRNLTDKYTLTNGQDRPFGLPGEYGGTFARPRQVIVQLTYNL